MYKTFKKQNKKQRAWAMKQVFGSRLKLYQKFTALTLLIIAVPAVLFAFVDPASIPAAIGITGGSTLALTMAAIGNIDDDSDYNSQGGPIAYEFRLVEASQINTSVNFPQPNASRELADITLNAGEVPHSFQSHSRPTYSGTGELNDYTIDPNKDISIALANIFRDKVLDFCEQKSGAKFILFFRKIEETQWYVVGSLDQPLRFSKYEIKGDADASVAVCNFTHKSIRQFYKYTGALSAASATVIAADATNLGVTSNDRYQLTDNTGATAIATVSGIAASDHGRLITVYGSGGSHPSTIQDNAVFTLAGGATWTGNAGSKISFRILDNTTLVEVLGSRVQTA